MNTNDKTLADVQPGGRVRLGDAPWPEIDAILADAYSAGAEGLPFEGVARRAAVRKAVAALAASQPVGEPVDDYDSAFQEANRPPYLVDAAGIYALQSFLTVAEEFRRSAEPYIEAINEGACGGEDEVSEAFDTQLARAKEAVSRSVVYAAPPAQAVDLGEMRKCADEAVEFINHAYGGHARRKIQELLALIDKAVGK